MVSISERKRKCSKVLIGGQSVMTCKQLIGTPSNVRIRICMQTCCQLVRHLKTTINSHKTIPEAFHMPRTVLLDDIKNVGKPTTLEEIS